MRTTEAKATPKASPPVESEVVRQLKAAKALIDTPEKWCAPGAQVTDSTGRICKRCSGTALTNVLGRRGFNPHGPALNILSKAAVQIAPDLKWAEEFAAIFLNDRRDHPTVMQMFDLAISMAQEEEG